MVAAILGRKIGMTRVFDEQGASVPVTVIQAGPCRVLQVRRSEGKDGYDAVQLGFEEINPRRSTKPMIGHAGKAGSEPVRFIREIRLASPTDTEPGAEVTVELFKQHDVKYVDIVATSKGRGFAGVMRRHNFGGQPDSHGTERKHRSPGSIGGHAAGATGRGIKKGKRMAGQMGHRRCTVRNQILVGVDAEQHVLLVRGGVPGPNGGYVMVRSSKTRS
jgi:large subunit ribosomal protein L3